MRRFLFPLTLVLLLVTAGFAASQYEKVIQLRRQLQDSHRQALAQSAEETQALTLALEKVLLATQATRQAELLHTIALSAGNLQYSLSALPLREDTAAALFSLTGRLQTAAAEHLPRAIQGALSSSELASFASDLAFCTQLSSQLALAQQKETSALTDALTLTSMPLVRPVKPALPRGLPKEDFTREQARSAAVAFIGEENLSSLTDAPDVSGTLAAYGMTAESHGLQLNLEVTRQGGKILWMMPETADFSADNSAEACITAALDFLHSRGFPPSEAVHYQVYDGLCVISAVPLQNDVLCYPDMLSVQVRMDTLQTVGLEARAYWTNHAERTLPEPALSAAEARELLSSEATCTQIRLCLIPLSGSEVLCWQCTCLHGSDLYYVYIDALTGEERAIRKVIPLEQGTTAA